MTSSSPSLGQKTSVNKTTGLVLSGGGIAAVGHIPLLATLEDLGIKPDAIAGTSMGAVIAACYGAGMSASDIEEHVRSIAREPAKRTWQFVEVGWASMLTGDLEAEHALQTLLPSGLPETLAEMIIPVMVVATDLLAREPAVFQNENTLKALSASIAIPGIFEPVSWKERIFVDGGVTNNLPVDVLPEADFTIAIDTGAFPSETDKGSLTTIGVLTESLRIMMQTTTRVRLSQHKNIVLLQPPSRAIGALDLHRIEEALDNAHKFKDEMKRRLQEALDVS